MITVYTKPGCPACVGTVRYLERHRLAYETIDVSIDTAAREIITHDLGYTSLPVVVTDSGEAWSGLRIDKLIALSTNGNDSAVIGE